MAASTWIVHTYHIGIGDGDSAIHLLLEQTAAVAPRYNVRKAVLIDGGLPDFLNPTWPRIVQVMAMIDNDDQYLFLRADSTYAHPNDAAPPALITGTRLRLKFDAVVITHWDNDHWGGILRMVREDLNAQVNELYTAMAAPARAAQPLRDQSYVEHLRPSFFKYQNAQPNCIFHANADPTNINDVNINNLLTTLYLPTHSNAIPTDPGVGVSLRASLQYNNRIGAATNGTYNPGQDNKLDWKFVAIMVPDTAATGVELKTFSVARVVAGRDDILGREVFYGTSIPNVTQPTNWTTMVTPMLLLQSHLTTRANTATINPKPPAVAPLMYIIAGGADSAPQNTSVIGRVPIATATRGVQTMVDVWSPASQSHKKNFLSVICMLASVTSTNIAGTQLTGWSLRHYFAGDALWKTETAVARWLTRTNNNDTTQMTDLVVPVMKLSHHGAIQSTPSRLLTSLQPKKIIVPNHDNDEWAHPRYEIILWLHAFWAWQRQQTANPQSYPQPLYCIYFPVYFIGQRVLAAAGPPPVYNQQWGNNAFTLANLNVYEKYRARPAGTNITAAGDQLAWAWVESIRNLYNQIGWNGPHPMNILTKFTNSILATTAAGRAARVISLANYNLWNGQHGNGKTERRMINDHLLSIWPELSVLQAQYLPALGGAPQIRSGQEILCFRAEIGGTGEVRVRTYDQAQAEVILVPVVPISAGGDGLPHLMANLGVRSAAKIKSTHGIAIVPTHADIQGVLPNGTNGTNGDDMPIEVTDGPTAPIPNSKKRARSDPNASDYYDGPDARDAANQYMRSIDPGSQARGSKAVRPMRKSLIDFDIESGDAPEPAEQHPDFYWYPEYALFTAGDVEEALAQRPPVELIVPSTAPGTFNTFFPFRPLPAIHVNAMFQASVAMNVSNPGPTNPDLNLTFLMSDTFDTDPTHTDEIRLTAGGINDFVSALTIGSLALKSPQKWSDTLSCYVTDINPADEWFSTMIHNGLGITKGSLVLDGLAPGQSAGVTVKSMSFISSNFGNSNWQLTFSTTENSRNFGIPDIVIPRFSIAVAGLARCGLTCKISEFSTAFQLPFSGLLGFTESFADMSTEIFQLTLEESDDSTANTFRNALFFTPNDRYETTLRLQFRTSDAFVAKLNSIVGVVLKNFTVTGIHVIGKTNSRVYRNGSKFEGTLQNTLVLWCETDHGSFKSNAWLVYGEDLLKFIIRPIGGTVDNLLSWFASQFTTGSTTNTAPLKPTDVLGDSDGHTFEVKQFVIVVGTRTTGSLYLQSIQADFSLSFQTPKKTTVTFLLTFSWPRFAFLGMLWTPIEAAVADSHMLFLPQYEIWESSLLSNSPSTVFITDFLPASAPAIPAGVPNAIGTLKLFMQKTTFATTIQFTAMVYCDSSDNVAGHVPRLSLDKLKLMIMYNKLSQSPSFYDIMLQGTVLLEPRENDSGAIYGPATLTVTLEYSSTGWMLAGSVQNLNLASLYSLFDGADNDSVMDLLEHLTIKDLSVVYNHSRLGNVGGLTVTAGLMLGPFELDLLYTSSTGTPDDPTKADATWSFEAWLSNRASLRDPIDQAGDDSDDEPDDTYTVGSFLQAISGGHSDISDLIGASFVADIPLPIPEITDATNKADALIALEVTRSTYGILFWIRIRLTSWLHFTFIQLLPRPTDPANPLTTKQKPKRVLIFSADKLPTVPNVPMMDKLSQPFDELDYCWVQDPNNTGIKAGLTRTEVELIADALLPFGQIFRYKDDNKPATARTTPGTTGVDSQQDILLKAGHHFLVVMSPDRVVLDYVFGSSEQTAISQTAASGGSNGQGSGAATFTPPATVMAVPDAGAQVAPAKYTLGPISVANIGLQFKQGKLFILLDATVALGPIKLTLIGFGLGIDLSHFKLNDFSTVSIDPDDIMLHGVSVSFIQPPVTASGVFVHEKTPNVEVFKGGIALGIIPYLLMAVGAYKHYTSPDDFKSVFIYARLDGPLLELEFATITGVRVGFGYNNTLTPPTAAQVSNFPLVFDSSSMSPAGSTSDPMVVLQAFGAWQQDRVGDMWVAAGLKVVAFQTLNITAVVLVSFDPLPTLSIIGEASASMPPKVPDPNLAFLYVKLGIIATLDIPHGSFRVEAQLSPDSFVLNRDVHLTGGFALCYWFQGSGHEGDWVFTVGGYHKSFKPPAHYPVPPRVGISWSYDSSISVTGEAYFAITPRVAMGGGRLAFLYDADPLFADLEAWADFLIQYKPFYMIIDIGISVHVGFTLDLWLVTIHINVNLGAGIHLEGPEFGGYVYVDFYLFGFTIYFGAPTHSALPVDLPTFLDMIKQPGPDAPRDKNDQTNADGKHDLTLSLENGSIPELNKEMHNAADSKDYIWRVRAGTFKFRIESKFAINSYHVKDSEGHDSKQESGPDIFSRPMWVEGKTSIDSKLTINITTSSENGWNTEALTKQMPAALWGGYSQDTDPLGKGGNQNPKLLSNTNTPANPAMINLWAGVIVSAPDPKLSVDTIPAFNAQAAMNASVFNSQADEPVLIDHAVLQDNLFVPLAVSSSDESDSPGWDTAQKALSKDGLTAERQAVVDLWTLAAGWDKTKAMGRVTPGISTSFVSLKADLPALATDQAMFGTIWMEAPLMSAPDPARIAVS